MLPQHTGHRGPKFESVSHPPAGRHAPDSPEAAGQLGCCRQHSRTKEPLGQAVQKLAAGPGSPCVLA